MIVDQLFNPKPLQEGGPYDLPGKDYDRPGDTPRRPRGEHNPYPYSKEEDDDHFREIFRKKREAAKKAKQRKLDEAMLLEDPVYRNFKVIGRYIAERKLTEPEILKVFADAETGMTDKATGANRTMLGRGKDTTMDFAGGVADALKGVWGGIQSSVPVSAVDVAYDQATDALANLTGGQKGMVMQAIKKYRMLAKQYPKTAGLAKGALVALTGLATGGAGLPAAAAFIYGLDSAIKGEKLSDIALKAGGAAATAWAGQKLASAFGGDQAAAGAETGGMGDPSQLPPFDDAGNLSPGFHISPDDGAPFYTGELAPTPTDIAAGYGPDGVAGLTGAEAAGSTRFDDIVSNAIDYKIKDGDTLTQILADKKINPEAFKRLPGNEVYFGPDGNPDVIKAGATIKLPRPEDVGTLNRMSFTTPDAAGGNLQRFLDDPDAYTGLYNPNNNRFSLDAATNLKQQELGRYASSDIAANRVAQDAARASGGPELLGGPGAAEPASTAISPQDIKPFGSGAPDTSLLSNPGAGNLSGVTAPSPFNLQPPTTPGGPQFGTVTLPDGQTLKAAAFPETSTIQPRLPMGSTPVTINYNGQELTGRIVNDTVYFTKFPADAAAGTTVSTAGTLSGVTGQQIASSPVYQQVYAQEIARYGAEPSARAIQAAQQIATMKAKAAMAGVVRENNILRTAKLRRLPVSELFDHKLTTLAWALNESVGKPQGSSVHLTGRGVNVVFDNVRRIAEAAVATRIEPTFEPIDEYPPEPFPVPPRPAPAPLGPELKFGSPEDTINRSRRNSATTVPLTPTTTPTPTTPTGPDRSELPDLYRPDMSGAPDPTEPPKNQSWFGKGLDYLDKGVKKVGGALSNFGHQFTTNVTKEKLKMNWHQAGKPSDSDQLAAWLVKQGVPQPVVTTVYDKMGIPYTAPVAEPTAPVTPDATTEPQAKKGTAQRLMPFNNINPKTGQRWTVDDLEARRAERNAQATAATDTTATDTAPAPTATNTTAGGPAGFNAGNVFKMPGMEKYAKSTPAKTPNFAGGPTGYGKTTMSVKPMTGVPGMKTTPAPAPTAAPAGTKVTTGGPTPDEKAKLAQRIAQATAKPVAEMLQMVETKEDVQRIKQFVDQTFTKYGAVNESAFAIRNQILEHVTQVGAQRRREHSRKAAH